MTYSASQVAFYQGDKRRYSFWIVWLLDDTEADQKSQSDEAEYVRQFLYVPQKKNRIGPRKTDQSVLIEQPNH